MKRTADIFLLLTLLVFAGILALFLTLTQKNGTKVIVRVDGVRSAAFSLHENRRYQIRGIGGTNALVVENSEAWLENADCPDCLCVKQGKISRAGESIICLPHQVVVELSGENREKPDAVAGKGAAG